MGPGWRKRKAGQWGSWERKLLPQGGWVGPGPQQAGEVEALGKDPLSGGCEPHPPQTQTGSRPGEGGGEDKGASG